MTVEVIDTGKLTPQQVLAGRLNDEIEKITAVIVIRVTDDGSYLIDHSCCNTSVRALAALLLADQTIQEAKC